MAASVIVDAGFLVALLTDRDANHAWAVGEAKHRPTPWQTCDAAISETFHLLGPAGASALIALLRRGAVVSSFSFAEAPRAVLDALQKYADVPMAFADACLVRMSEQLPNAVVLTTDSDFRIYRQQNRRVVPCVLP